MPGVSQRRFHSTIQGPAVEALSLLVPHTSAIHMAWRSELVQAAVMNPDEFLSGLPLDFASLADLLRKESYSAFRQKLQSLGARLASLGLRLDQVVLAFNRLYELCLAFLTREVPKRAAPVLAIARLHALVELLIVSGFKGQWGAGKKTLMEASLAENEDRRRGASAYVTNIYEEERSRHSQDLHDEVGHDLILVKMQLEELAMDSKQSTVKQVQPRLQGLIALVTHALESVRRLMLDLGPAVFDDLGFLPAIRSYANHFSSHTNIPVTVHGGFLPSNIPVSHQLAMYRLMQGALSNVLKHSDAHNVRIIVESASDAALRMVVEDDGAGFNAELLPERPARGITAMRERAEVLGGKFRIQSTPSQNGGTSGHGTRIEIDLPLPGGNA